LGTQYGSHDGTSEFEQGLGSLTGPGRIVVKSAGNDRGTARHAETFATPAGATITLSVSGSAVGRTFAIDGTYDASEHLRVRVTTPGGAVIGPIGLGAENAVYPGQVTAGGTVYLANDSLDSDRRDVYLEVNDVLATQGMSGTWSIVFLADLLGTRNGLVDLWRFYATSGLAANFVAGNQPTRELISEPGNAADVLTVGAFVTRTSWIACSGATSSFSGTPGLGALSTFSSPGPTRDGRGKPDLVAPGESIVSTTSFDLPVACTAPNVPSTYAVDAMNHTAMRGTSMAAPHVAGAVALLLQKRGALTPAEVKAYLVAHARRDALTGPAAGNDWGAGKLDLGDLVDPVVGAVAVEPGSDVLVGGTVAFEWSSHDSLGSVEGVDLLVSRTGPQGPFEPIAAGVPNSGRYDWTVTAPATGEGRAILRVVAHDTNGNSGSAQSVTGFTIHSPLAAEAGDAAWAPGFALGPVRPNPATAPVGVRFSLPREGRVTLAILDPAGRRVATLAGGTFAAGWHDARWDLTRRGRRVAAGLYFVAYDSPAGRVTRRVVVAR
jgi:subtilisin family serine protease